MNPEPFYSDVAPEIYYRSFWHLREPFYWRVTFNCGQNHTAEGTSKTKEGCKSDAQAADTRHAMHHARIEQQNKFPGRIRADEF